MDQLPYRSFFRRRSARRALFLSAALAATALAGPLPAQEPPRRTVFKGTGLDVDLIGDLKGFSPTVTGEKIEEGLDVITFKLQSSQAQPPPSFTLKWSFPSHDVAGVWTPGRGMDKGIKPDWARSRLEPSMLARNAPVVALFGAENGNVMTFAVSDALNTVLSGAGVREEDGVVYCEVTFFTERHRRLDEYTVKLRVDRRQIPYYQALSDLSAWWSRQPDYQPTPIPAAARQVVYSTWYNYHQSLDPKVLLQELALAKPLGIDTIIIDDGWQTLDSKRGYAFTGDWQPERFPDMKGFVEAAHKLGVKVMLWYAVPFVGKNAKITEKFKRKTLRYEDRLNTYVLDPRFPDVREMVIGVYRRALREWGVDGFKLDFIERFVADEKTVFEARDGRDFASVNEATDRLMTDLMSELRKVRSDVLIEFRQPYIGPLIRKYGNMLRASDCPNNYLANRVRTLDLRLLSGETAVHADMIMWHPGEPVEAAALQLLNVMFSVPQISVRLREIPADHLDMLRFYTAYWNTNRKVLLDGKLEPLYPAGNYPVVVSSSDSKQIVGLYGNSFVRLDGRRGVDAIDVLNAKGSDKVILSLAEDMGPWRYAIFDPRGRPVKKGDVQLRRGTADFTVPPSGMIALERAGAVVP